MMVEAEWSTGGLNDPWNTKSIDPSKNNTNKSLLSMDMNDLYCDDWTSFRKNKFDVDEHHNQQQGQLYGAFTKTSVEATPFASWEPPMKRMGRRHSIEFGSLAPPPTDTRPIMERRRHSNEFPPTPLPSSSSPAAAAAAHSNLNHTVPTVERPSHPAIIPQREIDQKLGRGSDHRSRRNRRMSLGKDDGNTNNPYGYEEHRPARRALRRSSLGREEGDEPLSQPATTTTSNPYGYDEEHRPTRRAMRRSSLGREEVDKPQPQTARRSGSRDGRPHRRGSLEDSYMQTEKECDDNQGFDGTTTEVLKFDGNDAFGAVFVASDTTSFFRENLDRRRVARRMSNDPKQHDYLEPLSERDSGKNVGAAFSTNVDTRPIVRRTNSEEALSVSQSEDGKVEPFPRMRDGGIRPRRRASLGYASPEATEERTPEKSSERRSRKSSGRNTDTGGSKSLTAFIGDHNESGPAEERTVYTVPIDFGSNASTRPRMVRRGSSGGGNHGENIPQPRRRGSIGRPIGEDDYHRIHRSSSQRSSSPIHRHSGRRGSIGSCSQEEPERRFRDEGAPSSRRSDRRGSLGGCEPGMRSTGSIGEAGKSANQHASSESSPPSSSRRKERRGSLGYGEAVPDSAGVESARERRRGSLSYSGHPSDGARVENSRPRRRGSLGYDEATPDTAEAGSARPRVRAPRRNSYGYGDRAVVTHDNGALESGDSSIDAERSQMLKQMVW